MFGITSTEKMRPINHENHKLLVTGELSDEKSEGIFEKQT